MADAAASTGPRSVRVLPDVAAIGREFDYLVPPAWLDDGRANLIEVGSRIRIELHGRRVGGWITAVDPPALAGVELRPLAKVSGLGPDQELLDLARWAADRWVGPLAKVLTAATPPKNVVRLPAPARSGDFARAADGALADVTRLAFSLDAATVRIPPAGDRWPVVEEAVSRGNPLFVAPTVGLAQRLAHRLRRSGVPVALLPDQWGVGAAGATVVGARAAVFARTCDLGSIVVFDEHDEALQDERTPTWHAREVALERARRAGVPCVLTSPTPSAEAAASTELLTLPKADERAGWARVEPIDRRDEPPGRMGLFSERLVSELRSARRVACVLNRKGRSRLLACPTCGELTRCGRCDNAVRQIDNMLECQRCGDERPVVCANCGATKLKNLRMGIARARVELEALIGEPVAEITADGTGSIDDARVVVGTEAILRANASFGVVAFLDFDQELLAMRQRAAQQAFGLIGLACRLVGPRAAKGRVLLQTRQPEHPAIQAAVHADPARFMSSELDLRRSMGWPPFAAQAEISGAVAPEFIARLGQPLGLEVRGPTDDRWLVRAPDAEALSQALADVDRPEGRMRIAVDPPRV